MNNRKKGRKEEYTQKKNKEAGFGAFMKLSNYHVYTFVTIPHIRFLFH